MATIGLIAGGVAAAGIGVAAAAGGGGSDTPDPLTTDDDRDGVSENAGDCNDGNPQVNPSGTIDFTNARFEDTSSVCPDGANDAPTNFTVLVDGVNNRCGTTVTITSASVQFVVQIANRTNNRPGQRINVGNLTPSPATVGSGVSATVRVDPRLVCTNPRGPSGGAFNEFSANVTLNTSAGNFTLATTNRHRTSFPVGWGVRH